MNELDFSNDKTVGTYEVLPNGEYTVACTDAIVKTTKTGNGSYINAEFTIREGNHEGRKLFQNFTLTNPNETAVNIGRGQIKSFLIASGATSFTLKSVSDLCGKTAIAKVAIEKSEEYGDRNKITSFRAASNAPKTNSAAKSANPFA